MRFSLSEQADLFYASVTLHLSMVTPFQPDAISRCLFIRKRRRLSPSSCAKELSVPGLSVNLERIEATSIASIQTGEH